MERNGTVSNISKSHSIQEMADFWDSHDATDFDTQTHEVEFEFDLRSSQHYIAVDPDLLAKLRQIALSRGLGTESLANLWLQERALREYV